MIVVNLLILVNLLVLVNLLMLVNLVILVDLLILDNFLILAKRAASLVLSKGWQLYHPASGRVGRVTDCGVRGLWFKSPGSILTFRTETSSLS